jgi:hypothetical protein
MLSGVNNGKTARMRRLWSSLTSVRSGVALLLALSLSGCLTTNTIVIDDCDVFSAISYSASHDTPETVSQIRRHNASYLAVCTGSR